MRTKHQEVMKLFEQNRLTVSKMRDSVGPFVRLSLESQSDAELLHEWLEAITGEEYASIPIGGDEETIVLKFEDELSS